MALQDSTQSSNQAVIMTIQSIIETLSSSRPQGPHCNGHPDFNLDSDSVWAAWTAVTLLPSN